LSGLLSKQKEIVQKEADQETATKALELATKSLDDCQKQSGIRKQELEDASKQLQQGKDALSQLLGTACCGNTAPRRKPCCVKWPS
jgi:DNA repair protein SbcC/Rad50